MPAATKFITDRGRTALLTLGLATLSPLASAIDIIDEFDAAGLDTNRWFEQGQKTISVSDGRLNWSSSNGNWGDGEIESVQNFALPPTGQTTTITWQLAPATITLDNPNNANQSLRYQIGVFSNNEPANFDEFGTPAGSITRREHYPNEEGGIWFDITHISNTNPTTVQGGLFHANKSKTGGSNAPQLLWATLNDWDFANDPRTIRLEITESGYTWFDGDTELGFSDWLTAGITDEFAGGFRVMALVMNFDAGRGFGGLERLAIENAFVPSPTLSDYRLRRSSVVAGQLNTLSWSVAPGSTITIEPDIGDVTPQTDNEGKGSLTFTPAADDVPSPTEKIYTITVVNGADTITRNASVIINPRPRLNTADFHEDFDTGNLNPEIWESRGGKTFAVADSYLTRNTGGGNWGRHEINTVDSFPLPPAGNTTTIKWNLGPATVTAPGDDGQGRSVRHQIGIISYHERAGNSRETWNNTTGGIYLDLFINGANTTGITGGVLWNDDQKPNANQYPWRGGVTVPDWNWLTEDHEFSLEITPFGYTWYSGQDEINSGTWAADNLDNEWANGFRVFACGMNYSSGDGTSSVQSISVDNGGEVPFFNIVAVSKNAGGVDLTWESTTDEASVYNVERRSGLAGTWTAIAENLASTGETTSYTDTTPPVGGSFYRITKLPPPPIYFTGFEAAENLAGWSEQIDAGATLWEIGAPTSGPGTAKSGDQVYATKLDANYDTSQQVSLLSPLIDISGQQDLVLQFYHYYDIEADFDFGTVDILDESGLPVLVNPAMFSGNSGGWILANIEIPADAPDKIQLRFELFADGAGSGNSGWYLDDVSIR